MPLAIDLFCGLGGWTEGLLVVGYDVIGVDIERHVYGLHRYPAQLVLQDVLTIHGRQFKNAALIVASPPCQAYSYRAMPWKKAKALPPPDNSLFQACFRIQREACEAAGRHIPLVVENVRGAQKWVGRSKYHFGSFHLWGDVPALMPLARGRKNAGGSWFQVAHNTTSGVGQNPDGRLEGVKVAGLDWNDRTRKGQAFNTTAQARLSEGVKQRGSGPAWFDTGLCQHGSQTSSRKAASAQIAKIPRVLAEHIGRAWWPQDERES